ncbi:MAG: DUF2905 domain-containing protein [Chloroflexi bacterium]|nr:MAG: DUF2905 domain-containing protein [Chloroflexota bacterium]RLC95027.1 MAG: DUF2905 domain-containing protein [Chloroflexota bacterium]
MFGIEGMGKFLILIGVFLVLFGLLFTFWNRIPLLGKLPGDITFEKGGFQFFLPLATCLIVSIVLTVVLNLVFRLFR